MPQPAYFCQGPNSGESVKVLLGKEEVTLFNTVVKSLIQGISGFSNSKKNRGAQFRETTTEQFSLKYQSRLRFSRDCQEGAMIFRRSINCLVLQSLRYWKPLFHKNFPEIAGNFTLDHASLCNSVAFLISIAFQISPNTFHWQILTGDSWKCSSWLLFHNREDTSARSGNDAELSNSVCGVTMVQPLHQSKDPRTKWSSWQRVERCMLSEAVSLKFQQVCSIPSISAASHGFFTGEDGSEIWVLSCSQA